MRKEKCGNVVGFEGNMIWAELYYHSESTVGWMHPALSPFHLTIYVADGLFFHFPDLVHVALNADECGLPNRVPAEPLERFAGYAIVHQTTLFCSCSLGFMEEAASIWAPRFPDARTELENCNCWRWFLYGSETRYRK
jgi:hypothetical protein